MKEKPSFDIHSDQFRNADNPLDNPTPSDSTLKIQYPEEYNKPLRETKTWCSYMERGFRASRVIAGAPSGNQIDTPESFIEQETSIDKLYQNKIIQ